MLNDVNEVRHSKSLASSLALYISQTTDFSARLRMILPSKCIPLDLRKSQGFYISCPTDPPVDEPFIRRNPSLDFAHKVWILSSHSWFHHGNSKSIFRDLHACGAYIRYGWKQLLKLTPSSFAEWHLTKLRWTPKLLVNIVTPLCS